MNESLGEFYSHLLGIDSPWEIEAITRDSETREVHARVIYIETAPVTCPICNKAATVHDH